VGHSASVFHFHHYMSLAHLTASSTSNLKLQLVFNNALREYEKQTNINLLVHPLAAQLQSCNSTSAILNLLREQVRDSDGMSTKWLYPMVNVLCAPSMALGERVVLVCLRDISYYDICISYLFRRLSHQRK
jgi:hypothetical protein